MTRTNLLAGIALVLSATGLPSLASAQDAPEDIVVTGKYGEVPDSVQSLSQAVSYADLDLSTKDGRQEIRHRISLTARFLCDKLGESTAGSPLIASCRDAATRDAMARLGTLEESFAPRGTTWVRPPLWAAPYPSDWPTRYP